MYGNYQQEMQKSTHHPFHKQTNPFRKHTQVKINANQTKPEIHPCIIFHKKIVFEVKAHTHAHAHARGRVSARIYEVPIAGKPRSTPPQAQLIPQTHAHACTHTHTQTPVTSKKTSTRTAASIFIKFSQAWLRLPRNTRKTSQVKSRQCEENAEIEVYTDSTERLKYHTPTKARTLPKSAQSPRQPMQLQKQSSIT